MSKHSRKGRVSLYVVLAVISLHAIAGQAIGCDTVSQVFGAAVYQIKLHMRHDASASSLQVHRWLSKGRPVCSDECSAKCVPYESGKTKFSMRIQ